MGGTKWPRIWTCVFEVREALLGAEHPDTLTSVSNLAMVLAGSGEVRGGRGDEPASAGEEREGAGEGAPRHADQRILPGFPFPSTASV